MYLASHQPSHSSFASSSRWLRVGLAALLLVGCKQKPAPAPALYPASPGWHWDVATPGDAGLDATKLGAFGAAVGGSGCVTRHGQLVYQWGEVHRRFNVASAGKPVLMLLLLKAVESGKLASLDTPIVEAVPELAGLNPQLDHKDLAMTWRHFITQTSCYGVQEKPGTAFDYSDYQTALFFDSLMGKIFDCDGAAANDKVLAPLLAKPLGCEDSPRFVFDQDEASVDEPLPDGRLQISPRDFCRIGLLVMRGGAWNGIQIVDAEQVRASVSSPLPNSLPRTEGEHAELLPGQRTYGGDRNQEEHMGSYSWMWWVNGMNKAGQRLWPDAPADTFGAVGNGGVHAMVVIPSEGIVVAWCKSKLQPRRMYTAGRKQMSEALRLLLAGRVQ